MWHFINISVSFFWISHKSFRFAWCASWLHLDEIGRSQLVVWITIVISLKCNKLLFIGRKFILFIGRIQLSRNLAEFIIYRSDEFQLCRQQLKKKFNHFEMKCAKFHTTYYLLDGHDFSTCDINEYLLGL